MPDAPSQEPFKLYHVTCSELDYGDHVAARSAQEAVEFAANQIRDGIHGGRFKYRGIKPGFDPSDLHVTATYVEGVQLDPMITQRCGLGTRSMSYPLVGWASMPDSVATFLLGH